MAEAGLADVVERGERQVQHPDVAETGSWDHAAEELARGKGVVRVVARRPGDVGVGVRPVDDVERVPFKEDERGVPPQGAAHEEERGGRRPAAAP